jgi:heat shock protein HslJ
MSTAGEVLARFVRGTEEVFGSGTWTMTEIDGLPAMRHSPTHIRFRGAHIHAHVGCHFWNVPVDLSERHQQIQFGRPKENGRDRKGCAPDFQAPTARLRTVLESSTKYDLDANELRLMAGPKILSRFARNAPPWPASTLSARGPTFWTAIEIDGKSVPAKSGPTLNLVASEITGKAGNCDYVGRARYGHGEILFWGLSSARKTCNDPQLDALLTSLRLTTSYEVVTNTLTLRTSEGKASAKLVASLSNLPEGTWWLAEIAGEKVRGGYFTMKLPSGRAGGYIECNVAGGRVHLGDGLIAFSNLRMTLKGCPGKPPSNIRIDVLSHAKRYELKGRGLILFDDNGAIIARFRS